MFEGTEIAALRIWSDNEYLSSLGNFLTILYMIYDKFMAFCHICKSLNVLIFFFVSIVLLFLMIEFCLI